MKLRLLLSLSLLTLSAFPARAQTADDFFHGGAQYYLSNNVAAAIKQVDDGLKRYPNDVKLKKLEELLKRQNQQQSQQEQKESQENKDQQQQPENKPDQQQQQQQQKPSPGEQEKDEKTDEPEERQYAPGEMTPQQAKQLLDAQKDDEKMLPVKPEQKAASRRGPVKDW